MLSLGFWLLVFGLIAMISMLSFQRRIVFPRHLTTPYPNAGLNIPDLEKMWVSSSDGPIEAWFLPGDNISAENPGAAVLFAHGNAELIDYWTEPLSSYRRMGISVFLPEYRGYGRSAGSPSQQTLTEDFVQFYDQLIARKDVNPKQIIFHGRSLGGGVVCALAEHRKPAAFILQSTFISVRELAKRFWVPGFLMLDPFDNISVISKSDLPVLIIHGRQDELIPFKHAESLHATANNSTLIPYDCDHNSCPPDWNVFWKDIQMFLKNAKLLKP